MSRARSESQAVDRYSDSLQLALSTLCNDVWLSMGRDQPTHQLLIPNGPIGLRDDDSSWFYLDAGQKFKVYYDRDRREYRVRTLGYMYTISRSERLESELIGWHWHPPSKHRPHLHVDGGRQHIPTGRVTFEAVARYLFEELGVKPNRPNWNDVLTQCESQHMKFRSWHTEPEIG